MEPHELKRLMLSLGWTQADLARSLKLSPNHVSRMTRGEATITGQTAKLARLVAYIASLEDADPNLLTLAGF